MNNYKLTVKHDNGKVTFKTSASDEQAARKIVCNAENCPDCAIIKVVEYPIFYKVVKMGRKSHRRQILGRGYNEETAQRIVKSYPDSKNSMVFYTNQNKW